MDAKPILLVTLALLTAAYSPLNIYGEKLQDARRWYARGREAMAKCHPQRGAGDARENCAPLLELPGGGLDGGQARFLCRRPRGRQVGRRDRARGDARLRLRLRLLDSEECVVHPHAVAETEFERNILPLRESS